MKRPLRLPAKYSTLSPHQRRMVREEYVRRQNGRCYYCGILLSETPQHERKLSRGLFPPNFFTHPIHLHHHHDTDLTIGAVHCECNAILWQYHGE